LAENWKDEEGERKRQAVVASYLEPATWDAAFRAQLDSLARLAAKICDAPVGVISLVGANEQTFVGRCGIEAERTGRELSFCNHAMYGAETMIVPDATRDRRFSDNALVTGDPNIRFYAGQPLISPEGAPIGAFCIIDNQPRESLTRQQLDDLKVLTEAAKSVMERARFEELTRRADVSSREALADVEQRFEVLADALPQLVWSTPPDGLTDYFSDKWCEFTGHPAEVSYGNGWLQFLHPDDLQLAANVWQNAVRTGQDYEVRYRLRRHDGQYRWVLARGLPQRSFAGEITRWVGTCTDINEEVETAEKSDLMSQELNHRIKNIFAVISGLLSMTMRNNPEIAPLASELQGRVLALGRAHDFVRTRQVTHFNDLGSTSLRAMLEKLLAPYSDDSQRIRVIGRDIAIDDRSATPLALFFHELATNSAKYGALTTPEGFVEIRLIDGDPVKLEWSESKGPEVSPPARTGFGYRLCDMSVSRQLGGNLAYNWNPQGLQVTAAVPRSSMRR